ANLRADGIRGELNGLPYSGPFELNCLELDVDRSKVAVRCFDAGITGVNVKATATVDDPLGDPKAKVSVDGLRVDIAALTAILSLPPPVKALAPAGLLGVTASLGVDLGQYLQSHKLTVLRDARQIWPALQVDLAGLKTQDPDVLRAGIRRLTAALGVTAKVG